MKRDYIEERKKLFADNKADQEEPEPHEPDYKSKNGPFDYGIKRAVNILRENNIETCQSCEGGPGHAYPEPTVEFLGSYGEGFRALSICFDNGLPVSELKRVWSMNRGEPEGPIWQITFRQRMKPRDSDLVDKWIDIGGKK
jgi:hypothetical protein